MGKWLFAVLAALLVGCASTPKNELEGLQYAGPSKPEDEALYVNSTTGYVHRCDCPSLRGKGWTTTLEDASRHNRSACPLCKPNAPSLVRWNNQPSPNYTGSGSKDVHVKGYTRKDGTYVRPHTRSRPK